MSELVVHTYQREFGPGTLYCRLTMLTVRRNALLTGSTVFMASLMRMRWTWMFLALHAPMT